MKIIRVLNLYACLGGNRYKWDQVAKDCNVQIIVTAVELDRELARMYQERFPNDKVIVADAHQYLLEHYKQFDFIWSSPPCPTHSRARFWNSSNYNTKTEAIYPDMKLYEEILFLKHYFRGSYVVENVIPYYKPLITPKKIGRHFFWSNFKFSNIECRDGLVKISSQKNEVMALCEFHKIELQNYKGNQRKDKIARNLVDYKIGSQIFKRYLSIENAKNYKQIGFFDKIKNE